MNNITITMSFTLNKKGNTKLEFQVSGPLPEITTEDLALLFKLEKDINSVINGRLHIMLDGVKEK